MEKFIKVVSTAVPLPLEDVDTDQIIPARFLKSTSREGFGENLFRDWRYTKANEPQSDFVLNNDLYQGKVLVAGKNFGCGSSREHAAWALYDYGFRVVISSFFADIFKGNSLNNGLLPLVVEDQVLHKLFNYIEEQNDIQIEIDLLNQQLSIPTKGLQVDFDIDPYKKMCLVEGKSDLDVLLGLKNQINAFEKNHVIY
jgi:3-isopropylmalate/(R)-2-methylmalate dehydratase small subunit